MNSLNEIYVAVKDTDFILAKIDNLCHKYNSRSGINSDQQKALFRSYCHDTIDLFEECFENSMLGIIRCKKKVERYQKHDDINIGKATFDIVDMFVDLKIIVKSMVPIKDLPSCKDLIELSPEDIVSKAKDLVKNDIVKAIVGTMLIGSKACDVVKIEDVKGYYNDRLNQLNSEILIKGKPISPMEQFLLDKFNAEIGYCNLALFKAGLGIADELKDLVEISKRHIVKYEQSRFIGNGSLVLSQSSDIHKD